MIPSCLTLSIVKNVSRVKWNNPRKGVAHSPTPRYSSYWKRSLRVALNYGRQLYLYKYIYIYIIQNLVIFISSCVLLYDSLKTIKHSLLIKIFYKTTFTQSYTKVGTLRNVSIHPHWICFTAWERLKFPLLFLFFTI